MLYEELRTLPDCPQLEGNLVVLSIVEVVQLLSACSSSGSLHILSGWKAGFLYFYCGRITAASSPLHPPLATATSARRPMTESCSTPGFVDFVPTIEEPDLDRVIEQIQRAFHEILRWEGGYYYFRSASNDPRVMSKCDHHLQIDVHPLLLCTTHV